MEKIGFLYQKYRLIIGFTYDNPMTTIWQPYDKVV